MDDVLWNTEPTTVFAYSSGRCCNKTRRRRRRRKKGQGYMGRMNMLLSLMIIGELVCFMIGVINMKTVVTAANEVQVYIEAHAQSETKRPLLPGFYIFGDSTVDCGNNDYLVTLARADMPPYGRDFDNHEPTGRFCNGRLSVDYLASYMGLPMVPTALATTNVTDMTCGLNFASAGAGILPQSGSDLGQHISFSEQLGLFSNSQAKMSLLLGQSRTRKAVAKSIFYISIGNNDFIHYYLRNVSGVMERQTSTDFSSMLLENLSNHLKFLIGGGIKRVVLVGIGPLGCAPNFLSTYNSSTGDCIPEINSLVQEYNLGLALLTAELSAEFPQANLVFCDIFDSVYDIVKHAETYGFKNTNTACCGAGKYGGWISCVMPQMACSDASKYVFWDAFHPTERVNYLTSLALWNGSVCSPSCLQELATS